jgi:hypothetical protein
VFFSAITAVHDTSVVFELYRRDRVRASEQRMSPECLHETCSNRDEQNDRQPRRKLH